MTRRINPEEERYRQRRMTREEAMARQRRRNLQLQRKRRKRKRRRILIGTLAVLLILIALVVGLVLFKLGKIDRVSLKNIETYQDSGPYTNIVLYGLDSRDGELTSGVNSDTIIIASISNETNDVKLVSVYRDNYLMQTNGYFAKINSAYQSGVENSINTLNMNLDLDIKNYIAINFKALVKTIDDLGGIEMDLTAEEAYWTDGYINETSQVVGMEATYLPNQNGGTYTLNGLQATAYCRIRYTQGDDFKRTERQRLVLQKVLEKAKEASASTLNEIVDDVFPEISTSLTNTQLLSMALNVGKYNLTDTTGFAFDYDPDWRDDNGSENVVPAGLTQNVTRLHEWLFPDQEYTVSEEVQTINDKLINVTGVYPPDTTDDSSDDSDY